MDDTSLSLLDRLKRDQDPESWRRLLDLYTPLIRGWLRRHGLSEPDADDLVQEVLIVVVRRVPDFVREPRPGAFRRWLKTITVHCAHTFWRSRKRRPAATGDSQFLDMLQQLENPESGLSQLWDQEHDRHVFRHLMEQVRPQFTPATWEAFRRFALDDESAEDVATALGMTTNAVFIAKSRVLRSLRELGKGFID